MISYFKKLLNSLLSDWENKKYFSLIGKLILFAVCSFIVVLILTAITMRVCNFVAANWQFIFLVGGGGFVVVYYIKEHFADKEKERLNAQEQNRIAQEEADSETVEANYKWLRATLFEVTSYLYDVIHIKKPTTETDLDSPTHYVRKLDFILYQFVLFPTAGIDTESVKKLLQQEYIRRLDSKSFLGIGNSRYVYEGQAVPLLNVYDVVSNGAYLTVSLAIADKNYCRYTRRGVSAHLLQQAEQLRNLNDRDF